MRHAIAHERGGLDPLAFAHALGAAKVTMNLIAADPELRELVTRKLAEMELSRRLSA